MSVYTVLGSDNDISVECDGKTIELLPMFDIGDPLFSYGDHSDASSNLGHAILHHCCGAETADIMCVDVVNKFLHNKTQAPFEITAEDIKKFVQSTAEVGLKVQDMMNRDQN